MRVTLRDVAKEAGLSVAAVSAALNARSSGSTRVSVASRQKVFDAAAKLGYIPNPIARSLSTGRTGVLGLVFPYVDAFVDRNPFCSMVMSGVFSEAIADSYNMMLYTVRDGATNASGAVDPRVDGLIMALPPANDPILLKCMESNFPCVAIVSENFQGSVMTVNADDFEGGRLATRHLIELGHTRVLMLHGGYRISTNQPRVDGYRTALAEFGLPCDENLIVEAAFDWRPAFDVMSLVLDRPRREWPTAVFAINDLCAAGALRAIKSRGLRIPEDIAIVGFDDTWFAATTTPALTTIRMPIRQMGATAVRMLVSQLEGNPPAERNPVLDVSLTIRQSCGAAPQSPAPDFMESEFAF